MSAERVALVSADQMRRMDRLTIDREKIPGLDLMEAAGAGTARGMLEAGLPSGPVAVLCGGGNNGGDGLVIARHLAKAGRRVTVLLAANPDTLPPDAAKNFDRLPVAVTLIGVRDDTMPKAREILEQAAVIVDALLGIGLSREVEGRVADLIRLANDRPALRVAADIPSGLSADTGQVLGVAIKADWTYTYGAFKLGQLIHPGAALCGRLFLVDIGIPKRVFDEVGATAELLTEARAREALTPRPEDSHKGHYGHVLVMAGSPGMSGAAVLATQAALRAGAGLVTALVDESARAALAANAPEALTATLPSSGKNKTAPHALLAGKTARLAGPGWGREADRDGLLTILLESDPEIPLVLDADALTLLAARGLPPLRARADRGGKSVLTPHPGEASRLLDLSVPEIQQDRPGAARRLAAQSGAFVVLKGSRTLVAAPDGALWVCPYGNPGMATGGSGDVLAGLVAGRAAGGQTLQEAVLQAVCAHAVAGDLACRESGQRGLIAGDLVWSLGAVWAAWEDGRDALALHDAH